MDAIPLLRARYGLNFLPALTGPRRERERSLTRVGLPTDLLERPDELVPADRVGWLSALCLTESGRGDVGVLAAEVMSVAGHGAFGARIAREPTLFAAMCSFCRLAPTEYSGADFFVTRTGDEVLFCRGPFGLAPVVRQAFELYVVVMMIRTVQMALGSRWRPRRLALQSSEIPELARWEMFDGVDIDFGADRSEVSVPLAACSAGIRPAAIDPPLDPIMPDPFLDRGGSLGQALLPYLRAGQGGIELAAEIAGTSVRTLQRQLAAEGVTFRGVVDRARFEAATRMLAQSDASLLDIAFELGYSDAAHFSRAFRRWAGTTPRDYRRVMRAGPASAGRMARA